MFPGDISSKFTLGVTKFSYLVTEALGPFFRKEMLEDILNRNYTTCRQPTFGNVFLDRWKR